MGFSNLLKQLRKQLRSKKRWLSLGSVLVLAYAASTGATSASASAIPGADPELLQAVSQSRDLFQVSVKRTFICGEENQVLGSLSKEAVLRYAGEHPEYRLTLENGNRLVFTQTVDDLSPHCKKNAYFGLDRKGNLTMFDGVPDEDRVIRTFFQLDVEQMKSSLPVGVWSQLVDGIRVADMSEFNSVLSTFSDYASSSDNRVMD